jgi:hypothetical protein
MSGIGSAPHPNTTRGERGRIPAHEVHELRKYRKRALTHSAAKRARIDQEIDDVQFFEEGLESELDAADMGILVVRSDERAITRMTLMLIDHENSYDKNYRPWFVRLVPRITHPLVQLNNHTFSTHTRFDKDGFNEVMASLVLLPRSVKDRGNQVHSLELALYLMLRRWHCGATWQDMSDGTGISRVELVNCYSATIELVTRHYQRVVTVLDYLRIRPLQASWSDTLLAHGAGQPNIIGAVDGKCQPWTSPGRGKFAQALLAYMQMHVNAGITMNLIQQVSFRA